jgi:hypothetical protein
MKLVLTGNLMDLMDWCGQCMALPSDSGWQAYNYVEGPVQTLAELIGTLRAAGSRFEPHRPSLPARSRVHRHVKNHDHQQRL